MLIKKPINPNQLRTTCSPDLFEFESTYELDTLSTPIGQSDTLRALDFGLNIDQPGYNIYVVGSPGLGKRAAIAARIQQKRQQEHTAPDWCYVHNFNDPQCPIALSLSQDAGASFKKRIEDILPSLKTVLEAHYTDQSVQLDEVNAEIAFEKKCQHAITALQEEAQLDNVIIISQEDSFEITYWHEGKAIELEEMQALPADKRKHIASIIEKYEQAIKLQMIAIKQIANKENEKKQEKIFEIIEKKINDIVDPIHLIYKANKKINTYLTDYKKNIKKILSDNFKNKKEDDTWLSSFFDENNIHLAHYKVNLLKDKKIKDSNLESKEIRTTEDLIGKIHYIQTNNTAHTNHMMIESGALHQYNGDHLILGIEQIALDALAWEALKTAIKTRHIDLSSSDEGTVSPRNLQLKPEPIPLKIKIILIGSRLTYTQLLENDQDFFSLFKVLVEFNEEVIRNKESIQNYARWIAGIARAHDIAPLDKEAVALLIDEMSREFGDTDKISINMEKMKNLLYEANYWRTQSNKKIISKGIIQKSLENKEQRINQIRERIYEDIKRSFIQINTQGERIGEVNGLSTIQVGELEFGQPSRISAVISAGDSEIIDIERESDLGGDIHTKGILILNAYIKGKYAKQKSLPFSSSITFEQNYMQIDGDSASLAELCALLSAISKIPIKQDIAITGSVDQHGNVQAVGSINEKIEGFFSICKMKKLNTQQGVIIPETNKKQLMLKDELIHACQTYRFSVYSVKHVEQAFSILTGLPESRCHEIITKRIKELAISSEAEATPAHKKNKKQ